MKKLITFLLLLGAITIYFLFFSDVLNFKKNDDNNNSKYSIDAVSTFNEYSKNDDLDNYDYSKTLEEAILSNLFLLEYLEEYIHINYLDEEDMFLENVNIFLEKGYTASEINKIFSLSSTNKEKLLELDYNDFEKYLNISNFDVYNISRYESYFSDNNELDLQTIVTHVNIGLDYDHYTNIVTSLNPDTFDVLVNKYNTLPSTFTPNNLTAIPGFESYQLVDEAATSISLMITAAKTDGFDFNIFSAYRSYARQEVLYNNYSLTYGSVSADTFSARAGHSEHQTGLAVDVYNPEHYANTKVRLNDEDYEWVLENAHNYGYIVRYPKNKTNITGYIEEPWHLRYLGVELATLVVNSNLTYDEYYDLYIKTY